jgi:hypothetical protein
MSGIPGHFTRENGEGFWGGYENRTDIHYQDGWRDEIIPEYNPMIGRLGSAMFNPELDAVTYQVIERTDLPTLENAKFNKGKEIKRKANELLSETDWYVIRKSEKNKSIPDDVSARRDSIRNKSNEMELQVMSFETLEEVLMFALNY